MQWIFYCVFNAVINGWFQIPPFEVFTALLQKYLHKLQERNSAQAENK